MSGHLSPEQQVLLINRALPQRPLSECLTHLADCAACRKQVSQLRGFPMIWSSEVEVTPAHLEYEYLSAYVLGKLDEVEREIAANHLAVCEFCDGEAQALTALQAELRSTLVVSQSTSEPATPATWREWIVNLWPRWFPLPGEATWAGPALALACCALVFLVSAGGWLGWRVSRQPAEKLAANPSHTTPAVPATPTSLPDTPSEQVSAASPPLLALLDHGQAITLHLDGSLHVPLALPPAYERVLKSTLEQRRLVLPAGLKSLAPPPNTLKGAGVEPNGFQVLAPVGRVLTTDRPTFRWQHQPEASNYVVAVFDEDFNPVLTSPPVTQTSWQTNHALPRGRRYLWQVTAHLAGRQLTVPLAPAPEARFQVLPQAKAMELHRARREFGQSHLLLSTLYAQAGLLDEAERELRALQRENPQARRAKPARPAGTNVLSK
jgi:hypothetical protein